MNAQSNQRQVNPITASVVRPLGDRELVLNKGADDGIEVGMRFAVLSDPIPMTDPVSGKELTATSAPKVVVKIVRIENDVAVGRTFRTIKGNPGLISAVSGSKDRIEKLELRQDDAAQYDRTIQRGDHAVQAFGDEYDDER